MQVNSIAAKLQIPFLKNCYDHKIIVANSLIIQINIYIWMI